MMLPDYYGDELESDFEIEEDPWQTYRVRFDGVPSSGMIDGLDALRQAIYLILQTERYRYAIYSWDYGVELEDLIGESDQDLAQIELQERISDALLQDDRILEVLDFEFTQLRHGVAVKFTVVSTDGDVTIETEVDMDV